MAKPFLAFFHKTHLHSIIILTFVCVIGIHNDGYSQSEQTDSLTRLNKAYLVSYWHNTRDIAVSPFHWQLRDWSIFAGVAGATAITFTLDEDISALAGRNRTATSEKISQNFIQPWGSGLYSLPLLAGIYLTGQKNSRHRKIALTGLKAYILSGAAVTLVKHISHRHRPYETDPPDSWIWDGPFPITSHYTSFASGHTTTAFAIASVLASGYKDKPWIGISAYTLASLVGISRIHDQKHWASDVLVGAALGTFIGTSLCRLNFKKVQINPSVMNGGGGVSLKYRL